jgi:hypothetical protein
MPLSSIVVDVENREMLCCKDCGEIYETFESHACTKSKLKVVSQIAMGVGAAGLTAAFLPADAMILIFSGAMMGGVWIYMVMKPMGDVVLDWLARHPKTFMLMHLPMTAGIAMLGEGLILAFGNLLGGVVATIWLVQWGRKHHISSAGKPQPGYVAPQRNPVSRWNRFKDRFFEIAME